MLNVEGHQDFEGRLKPQSGWFTGFLIADFFLFCMRWTGHGVIGRILTAGWEASVNYWY